MIRASVNGENCGVSIDDVDTIGDLLQQLEVYVPPRAVVVGLRINGSDCDDDPGAQVRTLPVLGVTEIDLQTRSPEVFACEARQRFEVYLAAIRQRFERAIECFDRCLEGDGLQHYRQGVEQLGLFVSLCDKLRQLGAVGAKPDQKIASDLQGVCDRLWTVQERQDFAGMRDVLAERLLPLLERWRDGPPASVL